MLSKAKNFFEGPEKRAQKRLNLKNKKYKEIVTHESETIKHLFKMMSPKMANFLKARREIEPFDDIDKIREVNLGQRLATLRNQIYQN